MVIARNRDQTYLTAEHLEAGLKLVVDKLDHTYIDVPLAANLVRPPSGRSVPYKITSCTITICPFCGLGKQFGYWDPHASGSPA